MTFKSSLMGATFLAVASLSTAAFSQGAVDLSGAQNAAQVAEIAKSNPAQAAQIFAAAQQQGLGSVEEVLAGVLAGNLPNEQRLAFVEAATQAAPTRAAQILRVALNGVAVDQTIATQYASAAVRGLEASGIPATDVVAAGRNITRTLTSDPSTSLVIGQAIADATSTVGDDTAETYQVAAVEGEDFETADSLTRTGAGAPRGFRSLGNVFANFGGGSTAASSSTDGGTDNGNGAGGGATGGGGTTGNGGNPTNPTNPVATGN